MIKLEPFPTCDLSDFNVTFRPWKKTRWFFLFSKKKNAGLPGLYFNGTLVHLDNLQNHRKTQSHPLSVGAKILQETCFKKSIKHRTHKTLKEKTMEKF